MSRRYSSLVIFLVLVLWTMPCRADRDWSLGKLNAFKKQPRADERIRASLSDEVAGENASTAAGDPRATSHSHEPSVLTKVNQGTKALFSATWDKTKGAFDQTKKVLGKTKQVLMPWERNEPTTHRSSRHRDKKDFSLFPSWWPGEKEKARPNSVKEFLALPRPGY